MLFADAVKTGGMSWPEALVTIAIILGPMAIFALIVIFSKD